MQPCWRQAAVVCSGVCIGSRSDTPDLSLKSEAVISQGEVYAPALSLSVVKTYEMAMCSVTWQ